MQLVSGARYDLNPGWGDMQASLAAVFREAPWTLRRGLYVRVDDMPDAAFSLYLGSAAEQISEIGQKGF